MLQADLEAHKARHALQLDKLAGERKVLEGRRDELDGDVARLQGREAELQSALARKTMEMADATAELQAQHGAAVESLEARAAAQLLAAEQARQAQVAAMRVRATGNASGSNLSVCTVCGGSRALLLERERRADASR